MLVDCRHIAFPFPFHCLSAAVVSCPAFTAGSSLTAQRSWFEKLFIYKSKFPCLGICGNVELASRSSGVYSTTLYSVTP